MSASIKKQSNKKSNPSLSSRWAKEKPDNFTVIKKTSIKKK